MRLRFKSTLVFIFILIIICSSVGVGYLFYTKVTNDSDIVVDGRLTINYLNGKKFSFNNDATVEFSITNNDEELNFYYIEFMDVDAGNVTYNLTSSTGLKISNKLTSEIVSEQIAINAKETVSYKLEFSSSLNESYSGIIQVGLKEQNKDSFVDVILTQNNIGDKSLSNFMDNATLDEGLLTAQDDNGIAYYFRGAVTNNNVSFAGSNWKIVKINGDGSVKLVYADLIDHVSKYADSDVKLDKSSIYELLNEWFDNHLKDYSELIAHHRFCSDTVKESDDLSYIAYRRLITNKNPTFVCLGETSNTKIGLLTADEVVLAGGSLKSNYKFYLYDSDIDKAYYTLTFAKVSGDTYYPFLVNQFGSLVSDVSSKLLRGIRPVINITNTAKASGTGTLDDPYIISKN